MSWRGDKNRGGTALRKAPLTGVDRLFGRDLRSRGWVVDLRSDPGGDSGRTDEDAFADGAPLPAMMWALRARRK